MCWSTSDKPAAGPLVISLQPLMCPSLLRLNQALEVGVAACAAARQTEERKHTCNDPICSKLGWKCVPLSLSSGDIWCMGKNTYSRPAFCTTSSTTCDTRQLIPQRLPC